VILNALDHSRTPPFNAVPLRLALTGVYPATNLPGLVLSSKFAVALQAHGSRATVTGILPAAFDCHIKYMVAPKPPGCRI
jgi:hypothetical protein